MPGVDDMACDNARPLLADRLRGRPVSATGAAVDPHVAAVERCRHQLGAAEAPPRPAPPLPADPDGLPPGRLPRGRPGPSGDAPSAVPIPVSAPDAGHGR